MSAAASCVAPKIDRVPPHDIEAERCILATMFTNDWAIPAARDIVKSADFFRPEHQQIFDAICSMADAGQPVDIVLLRDRMASDGTLDQIGGAECLAQMTDGLSDPSNLAYYAKIVRDKAVKRELHSFCTSLAWQTFDPVVDVQDLRAKMEATLEAVSSRTGPLSGLVRPTFLTASELMTEYPQQREAIIDGLLRRGEVANLVSGPKMFKSWLLLYAGLCLATGRPFLGFPTRQCRVLMLDYELAPGTLAKRLQAVASTLGIETQDIGDHLCIESLRGRRLDINAMAKYFQKIAQGQFDVVVVDPLYRTFPREMDENSNANLADLYGTLQGYAEQLDAAFIVVHHLTKGDQSGKSVTDLGSGGGSQSRAADAHLAIRPHAEDGAAVLSGVVRSFPPFEPIALRWAYPLWQLAPDLDPAELKRSAPRRKTESKAPTPPKQTFDANWLLEHVLTDKPETKDVIIALAVEAGVPNLNQARTLLTRAEATGKAHRWTLPKDNRAHFAKTPQPAITEVQ